MAKDLIIAKGMRFMEVDASAGDERRRLLDYCEMKGIPHTVPQVFLTPTIGHAQVHIGGYLDLQKYFNPPR